MVGGFHLRVATPTLWKIGSLAFVLIVAALNLGSMVPAQTCGRSAQYGGGCADVSGSFRNGSVDLRGVESVTRDGEAGDAGGVRGNQPDPNAWNDQRARDAEARGNARDPFVVVNPPVPPTVVTLADIASFAPAVGGNHMEPNGWMVVGLDTNFYSDGTTRVVDGTLLGLPAAVRFTPQRWTWNYGDGSAKTSTTPGASWAAQNLVEFAPTATSHVFANPGSYTIDLTVQYSAEYQFAGAGWVPVDGTLDLPANRIVATANDANTVLVNRDCRQDPRGPGC